MTWTATDAAGNSSSCVQAVLVIDDTAPTVTCPGNQTLSLDANCQVALPDYTSQVTVDENCTLADLVQSPAPGTIVNGETTVTITMTAIDEAANSSTCTFSVDVVDDTAPTITCPSDITEQLDANCELVLQDFTSQVTVTENCNSYTVTQVPAAGTVITGVSVTTIQLTATDAAGNSSSCSFNLGTIDVTAPTITCASDVEVSVSCGPATVVLTPPTVSDCGGSVTITSDYSGNTFPVGSTSITWTATDQYGNASSCVQVVTVNSPEIDIFGNGFEIEDGTKATSFSAGTNFGSVSECNGSATSTFLIKNNGTDTLYFTGSPKINIIGIHSSNFSIVQQPVVDFLLPDEQFSFDVIFDPNSSGNKNARIRVSTNDCDESPYTFFIRGRGTPCVQGGGSALVLNDDIHEVQTPAEEYSLQLNDEDALIADQLTIQLYPNPNNGRFYLNLSELPEDAMVMIYNSLGQIVYSENTPNKLSEIQTNGLNMGAYIVKVISGENTSQIRMLIQNH